MNGLKRCKRCGDVFADVLTKPYCHLCAVRVRQERTAVMLRLLDSTLAFALGFALALLLHGCAWDVAGGDFPDASEPYDSSIHRVDASPEAPTADAGARKPTGVMRLADGGRKDPTADAGAPRVDAGGELDGGTVDPPCDCVRPSPGTLCDLYGLQLCIDGCGVCE